MWVNPKLMNRLAESYSNGEMMKAYSGGSNNSYFNNSYNNYRGDEEMILNNNAGINKINNFTSNPEGLKQQMRFNEITNQWLNDQNQLAKPNQNLINFANNLTNSFNGIDGNTYPVQQHQQIPTEMTTAYAEPINDPNSQAQQASLTAKEGFDMPYSTERKFRNGTLVSEAMNKQTTMALIVICIIGFILFMLVQLYMSQKRLEYMFRIYRDVPINSVPYYVSHH